MSCLIASFAFHLQMRRNQDRRVFLFTFTSNDFNWFGLECAHTLQLKFLLARRGERDGLGPSFSPMTFCSCPYLVYWGTSEVWNVPATCIRREPVSTATLFLFFSSFYPPILFVLLPAPRCAWVFSPPVHSCLVSFFFAIVRHLGRRT